MKMVVIDTEISGPEPTDQVIEIGWITSASHGAELYRIPDSLELNPHNASMTGITKAMLDEHDEFGGIPDALKGRIWLSYNVQHDINWINHTLVTYGLEPLYQVPSLCLSELTKQFFELDRFIPMAEALKRLGISGEVKHRALSDANHHKLIFHCIYSRNPELVRRSFKRRDPQGV